MVRGAEGTKERLLDATERLLQRDGYAAVGVNAVAAECGVDKVLIYRYFGGLPQLLQRVAERRRCWPPLGEHASEPGSLGGALRATLLQVARETREDPALRETTLWENVESNPLTDSLAAEREREVEELLESLRARFRIPAYLDLEVLFAILAAGLVHLSTRRTGSARMFGIAPESDDDWHRVEKMITSITRVLTE